MDAPSGRQADDLTSDDGVLRPLPLGKLPGTPPVVEEMERWLHVDRKNSPEVWAGGVVEVKISDNGDITMSVKLTAWKKE